MFFCFRWILIQFKREFSFDDAQCIWEALWSNYLTPDLHLFFALAILMQHRDVILNNDMSFDDILKYVNNLAGELVYGGLLQDAEMWYHKYTYLKARRPEKKPLSLREPFVNTYDHLMTAAAPSSSPSPPPSSE
eukprot:TRINITY_DN2180_c0_g1_i9.p1 TRINITY_DN2180_c0_g1~~TRINITY_DN2180_c0_g1_i9.p1  ORF type:complete len:134 (-),score=23.41 TRINITY_DN2180_c0_g1_i9:36-437(-)